VQLVDHDIAQCAEQGRNLRAPQDEQRLERLRRDEQDARRFAQYLGLLVARHVAVPAVDGDIDRTGQRGQPIELIVDQRLEWAQVEDLDAGRGCRVTGQPGQHREEGGFGLP
jgi:hypothetical protein